MSCGVLLCAAMCCAVSCRVCAVPGLTSRGVSGGKSAQRLCPLMSAFQALVANGSTCSPVPLRAGPITNHLQAGRQAGRQAGGPVGRRAGRPGLGKQCHGAVAAAGW